MRRVAIALTVLFFLLSFGARAERVVEYTGAPIVVKLEMHKTRAVIFPYPLSKVVTGINTATLSVEQADRTLFFKALTPDMSGDFFVVENNGKVIHLILKVVNDNESMDDLRIVDALAEAKKTAKKYARETATSFLTRILRGELSGISVISVRKPIDIRISHLFSLHITKIYEDPAFKAYYGVVRNRTAVKIRLPIEDIYFKGLIGISPGKLYLKPYEKTDIYFVAYRG